MSGGSQFLANSTFLTFMKTSNVSLSISEETEIQNQKSDIGPAPYVWKIQGN